MSAPLHDIHAAGVKVERRARGGAAVVARVVARAVGRRCERFAVLTRFLGLCLTALAGVPLDHNAVADLALVRGGCRRHGSRPVPAAGARLLAKMENNLAQFAMGFVNRVRDWVTVTVVRKWDGGVARGGNDGFYPMGCSVNRTRIADAGRGTAAGIRRRDATGVGGQDHEGAGREKLKVACILLRVLFICVVAHDPHHVARRAGSPRDMRKVVYRVS